MSTSDVFSFAVVAVGIYWATVALSRHRRYAQAQGWSRGLGEILASELYRSEKHDGYVHYRVTYKFSSGKDIVGDTPRICGDWFWGDRAQKEFVAKYQVGQPVTVFLSLIHI